MKRKLRQALLRLARNVPPMSPLYSACRRYVCDCDGELNCDMTSNGELRVLRELLAGKSNPVCLDVGANRGDWTAAVLSLAPQATICCLEPCSSAFQRLQARGFPKNVKLFPLAAGAETAQKKLLVYGEGAGNNSLFQIDRDQLPLREDVITVAPLAPLADEQGLERIDLLKIDVEGSEFDVLRGAQPLLESRRIQAVQFEYGEGWIGARRFLKDVFDWLKDIPGYSLNKITARRTVPIRKYQCALDNFHNANYLILRDPGLA